MICKSHASSIFSRGLLLRCVRLAVWLTCLGLLLSSGPCIPRSHGRSEGIVQRALAWESGWKQPGSAATLLCHLGQTTGPFWTSVSSSIHEGVQKDASGSDALIVYLMCQLGWAMVSRYVVKHCYGCFCEGVFG